MPQRSRSLRPHSPPQCRHCDGGEPALNPSDSGSCPIPAHLVWRTHLPGSHRPPSPWVRPGDLCAGSAPSPRYTGSLRSTSQNRAQRRGPVPGLHVGVRTTDGKNRVEGSRCVYPAITNCPPRPPVPCDCHLLLCITGLHHLLPYSQPLGFRTNKKHLWGGQMARCLVSSSEDVFTSSEHSRDSRATLNHSPTSEEGPEPCF